MKFVVFDQDYDYIQLLRVCDTREEAEFFVKKTGYGEIEEVADGPIDSDTPLYYCGSGDKRRIYSLGGRIEQLGGVSLNSVKATPHPDGVHVFFQFHNIVATSHEEAMRRAEELREQCLRSAT